MLNTNEGSPIAGEVEYDGLNASLRFLEPTDACTNRLQARWLKYYLDYVEMLN